MEKIMTEDEKILEIIHENCKRQRKFNREKQKRQKKENIINNILMFIGSGIFFISLMYFIVVVENLKF